MKYFAITKFAKRADQLAKDFLGPNATLTITKDPTGRRVLCTVPTTETTANNAAIVVTDEMSRDALNVEVLFCTAASMTIAGLVGGDQGKPSRLASILAYLLQGVPLNDRQLPVLFGLGGRPAEYAMLHMRQAAEYLFETPAPVIVSH